MVTSRSRPVSATVLLGVGVVTIVVALGLGAGGNSAPGSPDDSPVDVHDERAIVDVYDGGSGSNPNRLVIRLLDFLGEMEDDLAGNLSDAGFTAMLQPGVPALQGGSPPTHAVGELLLIDDTGVVGSGSYSVLIHRSSGMADLSMELTEGGATRALDLGFAEVDDVLTIWGALTVDGGPPLSGGWTYSATDGVQEHPGSAPAFLDEVQAMLHVEEPRGIFGAAVQFLGSVVGVSNAFKKCMRGRAGCGGSYHNRVGFSCDDPDDCGPCGLMGGPYNGCSLGGSRGWYCDDTTNPCQCANVIFHEMSHSCFALDLKNGSTYDAYRVGYWFRDRCAGVP